MPFNPNSSIRFFDFVSASVFVMSLTLAYIFFQERVIFLDAAFKFFEMSATGSHAIQAHRFGDIMPQLFPLSAITLGLPFKAALVIYSWSYLLYGSIVYLIGRLFLSVKDERYPSILVLIPLMMLMMSSHSFFWFTNEQYAAYPLLILGWALVLSGRDSSSLIDLKFCFGIFALSIALITHPLMIVSHLFVIILSSVITPSLMRRNALICIWTALTYWIKADIWPVTYDQESFTRLKWDNVLQVFAHFNTAGAHQFMSHLFSDLIVVPIFLVLTVFILLKGRKLLAGILTICAVVGFSIINIASNPDGGAWFHIGTHYLPICTMLFFPILYIWESIGRLDRILFYIVLTVTILFKISHIIATSDKYKDRLAHVSKMAHINPNHHYTIIPDTSLLINRNYQSWASSYETMLYSTLHTDTTSNTLIIKDTKEQEWRYTLPDIAQGSGSNYKISELKYRKYKFAKSPVMYKRLKDAITQNE